MPRNGNQAVDVYMALFDDLLFKELTKDLDMSETLQNFTYKQLYNVETETQLQYEVDRLAHKLAGLARLRREEYKSIDKRILDILQLPGPKALLKRLSELEGYLRKEAQCPYCDGIDMCDNECSFRFDAKKYTALSDTYNRIMTARKLLKPF